MKYTHKYVFISHPYSDNPEKNLKKVDKICKYWEKKNIIPVSPLHLFSFYEHDNAREEIMKICFDLIEICDAIYVYGNSEGCRREREYAEKIGKPVEVYFYEGN